MTRFLIICILSLSLTKCSQSKKKDCLIIKTEFYSTGKIKNIFSLSSDNIKNGECFYFNDYGCLDSSVTFSNGTLEGLKKIYYDSETDAYEYKNGSLIKHFVYDSLNILKYETPLDIKKIGKTHIIFSNNRDYFDQNKVDTFTITTEGLPPYNRGLIVSGANFEHVKNDSTFTLRTNNYFKTTKKIKLLITVRQDISNTTEKATIIDSIFIPVK